MRVELNLRACRTALSKCDNAIDECVIVFQGSSIQWRRRLAGMVQ